MRRGTTFVENGPAVPRRAYGPRMRRLPLRSAVTGALAAAGLAAATFLAPVTGAAAEPDDPGAREPRIVGGSAADPLQHPWQVLLEPDGYLCGGSLVHPRIVLTAAHCVVDDDGAVLAPSDIVAHLGRRDAESGGTALQVRDVHVPDGYDPVTVADDWALVTLGRAAPAANVIKIAGAGEEALWASGRRAVVTGFGATSQGGPASAVLKQVTLPLRPDADCARVYGRDYDTALMLCAGFDSLGQDSCQGDSGGPLTVPSDRGRRLVGVVSYGDGCGAGVPGVYTRVAGPVLRAAIQQLATQARDADPAGFPGTDATLDLFGSGAQVPDAGAECDDAQAASDAAALAHRRAVGALGAARRVVAARVRTVRTLTQRGAPRPRIVKARRALTTARQRQAATATAADRARRSAAAAAAAAAQACA